MVTENAVFDAIFEIFPDMGNANSLSLVVLFNLLQSLSTYIAHPDLSYPESQTC